MIEQHCAVITTNYNNYGLYLITVQRGANKIWKRYYIK